MALAAFPLNDRPLYLSQVLLATLGVQWEVHYQNRIPDPHKSVLVVSNHRSFLDALLLMTALKRTVHFACHHYMGQVPILRDIVNGLGCFPLDSPAQRSRSLFIQAGELLQHQRAVGIFPEGASPMIQANYPRSMYEFHRGFAHLALRVPIVPLAILPVAIVALEETTGLEFPVQMLGLFDPSEPLFQQSHWHSAIFYQRIQVRIGRPHWITQNDRDGYKGHGGKKQVERLTQSCYQEIQALLQL